MGKGRIRDAAQEVRMLSPCDGKLKEGDGVMLCSEGQHIIWSQRQGEKHHTIQE